MILTIMMMKIMINTECKPYQNRHIIFAYIFCRHILYTYIFSHVLLVQLCTFPFNSVTVFVTPTAIGNQICMLRHCLYLPIQPLIWAGNCWSAIKLIGAYMMRDLLKVLLRQNFKNMSMKFCRLRTRWSNIPNVLWFIDIIDMMCKID